MSGTTPGTQINLAQLQPGDVIAFAEPGSQRFHHIGMFAGGGRMIHAPDEGQPGTTTDVTSPYWAQQRWNVRRFG